MSEMRARRMRIFGGDGASPPGWWWLGLAAMALLFALLRVMLEMDSGAESESGPTASFKPGGWEWEWGAFLRSCVPPSGAGAEEWGLWLFFMADILVMGLASGLAVWFFARPQAEGLGAAARIPLEDEGDV